MRAYPRRHRRWRHRNAQPLLLVPHEPVIIVAVAALGRTLYRYRSELAPLTTMLTLPVAAAYLHHSHARAWPWVGAAAGAAALLAGTRGAPYGVTRTEERTYAGIVTTAAGAWLTASTALGPSRPPLPAALVLGTLAAGVPWWTHRRRRARVRVDRTIQAWPDLAESIGLAGSRVMSAVIDVWGWRARMALRPGQTVADVIAHVPAIESGLGTRPGAVRVEPDPDHAGRFLLRVLAEDPHGAAVPWTGPTARSVAEPIPLGVFEDATDVRVPIAHRHTLIGGIAGSGKSGIVNVVVGNLVACPDVVLWGIDLKGGMELCPWAPCLARLATTPADATTLLRDAVRVLEARARALSDDNARLWAPSATAPALIVVIDEYAELAENAPRCHHARRLDRPARPSRSRHPARRHPTAHTASDGQGRRPLPDGRPRLPTRPRTPRRRPRPRPRHARRRLAQPHPRRPGKFLLSAEGHTAPRRARAYLVTDDDVRATAARYAAHRPELDQRSADAITHPAQPETEAADVIDGELATMPDPEAALWAALRQAPDNGLTVPDLMHTTGMGRTWIYDRLQTHAETGRAAQVTRGRWRATDPYREALAS